MFLRIFEKKLGLQIANRKSANRKKIGSANPRSANCQICGKSTIHIYKFGKSANLRICGTYLGASHLWIIIDFYFIFSGCGPSCY
jgi:hypothetical protein